MAKFFASKESRLARSGNDLAAGYGTLLPSYWYANVHLFPRVLALERRPNPSSRPFVSIAIQTSSSLPINWKFTKLGKKCKAGK